MSIVSVVIEEELPCTFTVSRPLAGLSVTVDIAHHADRDVHLGRGLGKTFGSYGDTIGTGEQAFNAEFPSRIRCRLASDVGPD